MPELLIFTFFLFIGIALLVVAAKTNQNRTASDCDAG